MLSPNSKEVPLELFFIFIFPTKEETSLHHGWDISTCFKQLDSWEFNQGSKTPKFGQLPCPHIGLTESLEDLLLPVAHQRTSAMSCPMEW